MELPYQIKDLFRHWEQHTLPQNQKREKHYDNPAIAPITAFVQERMRIWERKTRGHKIPYTLDPILSQYRFCNIYRELDAQTITFHTLLNPLRNDFPLWLLNMFYCRMIARPETINTLGLLSFDRVRNAQIYDKLRHLSRPRYGTPYVFPVSTILKSPYPTRELFITQHLPSTIPNIAALVQNWNKQSVYDGVQTILPLFGFKVSFLWTEVLIDTAYQFPEYISLFKRFPIGPGAIPTLKLLEPNKDPSILVTELALLNIRTGLTYNSKNIQLSAENWEGIACEYRKYTNLRNHRGRKRIYTPST